MIKSRLAVDIELISLSCTQFIWQCKMLKKQTSFFNVFMSNYCTKLVSISTDKY